MANTQVVEAKKYKRIIFLCIVLGLCLDNRVILADAGRVQRPPGVTVPLSAKLGTQGFVYYEVDLDNVEHDHRCSLDRLRCHTPRNSSCGSGDPYHYHVTSSDSWRLNHGWVCAIEIPSMEIEDVGEYYLCKKDLDTQQCNNIEVTVFEAWYMRNNERCEIKFNATLRRAVDNCNSTSRTDRVTTHSQTTTPYVTTELEVNQLRTTTDHQKTLPGKDIGNYSNQLETDQLPATTDHQKIGTLPGKDIGNYSNLSSFGDSSMTGVILGTALVTIILVLLLEMMIYKVYKAWKSSHPAEEEQGNTEENIDLIL